MMDGVIRGLETFVAVYLDDIVIFSKTWQNHLKHVHEVLGRLRKNHLTAKLKKCQFAEKECTYLGHVVGNGQVKPDPEKLKAVKQYPTPATKQQVRGLLGLTGYYRKFIGGYAKLAAPLTDLTKKQSPDRVIWTPQCEGALEKLKEIICLSPILMNPDFQRTFILQTDASNRGVRAVLTQKR